MATEKLLIMQKALWGLDDIQTFCGCGITRASKIMQEAKKISVSRFLPSKAKRDNVFQVLGLNYRDEVENIKLIIETEKVVNG